MAQKMLSLIFILTFCLVPGHVAAAQASDSPQVVTQQFYDWYLSELDLEAGKNPFGQQLYTTSPYLTAAMIQKLDELQDDPTLHHDPILCAQNIPEMISAEEISASDTDAVVLLHSYYGDNPEPYQMTLLLDQSEGSWKISDMRCEDLITPAGVVNSFYEGYTRYSDSPFLDGVYHDFDLMTSDLIARMDSLQTGTGIAQDPFLCGPELPSGYFTYTLWATGETAAVMVEAIIGNGVVRDLSVDLTRQNDLWVMANIRCDTTLAEKVLNFYNRYLVYTRYDFEHDTYHNLLTNHGFFGIHYLTPELKDTLRYRVI